MQVIRDQFEVLELLLFDVNVIVHSPHQEIDYEVSRL